MSSPRPNLAFSKTAPGSLEILEPRLKTYLSRRNRREYILNHNVMVNRAWWREQGIDLDLNDDQISRHDLVKKADAADSDQALLAFTWHVLAWGSGTSPRLNIKRKESITEEVDILRTAVQHARNGDVRSAYSSLIRRGGGVIPSLGPSFFTKILYFASEGTPGKRCLILDARVAKTLHELGWEMAQSRRDGSHWFNWYTDTYVSYCDLLASWSEGAGGTIKPDMFERALFQANGKRSYWDEQSTLP